MLNSADVLFIAMNVYAMHSLVITGLGNAFGPCVCWFGDSLNRFIVVWLCQWSAFLCVRVKVRKGVEIRAYVFFVRYYAYFAS